MFINDKPFQHLSSEKREEGIGGEVKLKTRRREKGWKKRWQQVGEGEKAGGGRGR